MREIIFKAKRVDNNEWVYGFYSHTTDNRHFIYDNEETYLILQNTLGQFTGLKDKDGKKIFEGDKIISEQWNPKEYTVMFIDGQFCFQNGIEKPYYQDIHYAKDFEITGNIYD